MLSVSAQAGCFKRDPAVKNLLNKYGEKQFALSTSAVDKTVIYELFLNEETGTFTMLVTDADGFSCMIVSGENWAFTLKEDEGDGV